MGIGMDKRKVIEAVRFMQATLEGLYDDEKGQYKEEPEGLEAIRWAVLHLARYELPSDSEFVEAIRDLVEEGGSERVHEFEQWQAIADAMEKE